MKSNLVFAGFGVLCFVFICVSSTNGRYVRYIDSKYKREVDPLPEIKVDVNEGQSQEEQNKGGDNSPSTQSINEEVDIKKNVDEIEEPQRRNNNNHVTQQSTVPTANLEAKTEAAVELPNKHKPSEEGQATALVFMEALAPTSKIAKEEPAPEIAQASNKKEVTFNKPAEEKDDEGDVADIKPAASSVTETVVKHAPHHIAQHKTYNSFWSRSAE